MASAESKALGTWRQVAVVSDGKNVPVGPGALLTVNEQGYTVTVNGRVYQRGSSRNDPTKTPPESDVIVTEGAQAGQTLPQIYRIDGDVLIACIAPAGAPRPTQFTSEPGSQHTLSVWLRVKDAAAARGGSAINWLLILMVVAVLVASNTGERVKQDLEATLGYWPGILARVAISTLIVTVIFLLIKWGWRAGLTLGLTMSATITLFDELRKTLEPTLGSPGAIAVSGASAVVASMILGAAMSRLLKLGW